MSRNITSLGTLQNNRPGIPKALKDPSKRENFSYQTFWEKSKGDMKIHSYTVKKKKGNTKNINVLTTLDTYQGITIDDGKDKPAAIKLYDYTKVKFCKWREYFITDLIKLYFQKLLFTEL